MNQDARSRSPAAAAEPRIDEDEVIISRDDPVNGSLVPRWTPLAMFALAFALWLILAKMI